MKMSTAIVALGALAQETRLEIFRLLVQKGPAGLAAGDVGDRLGLPSPTLSFHLNQLRFAGLVTSRRASRSIIYSANFRAMTGLLDYLTENCCGGSTAQCAPQTCTSEVRAPAPATVEIDKPRGRRRKPAATGGSRDG
jgi:ArsR family transcriptional regulator